MAYELGFLPSALKEWTKLAPLIREQFKKKLAELLVDPRISAAKLSGAKDRYKIKLRSAGYRLVYEVRDSELVIVVIAVGKRERDAVYKAAAGRGVD
jgi:mRNA interferase RelE/StbE